MTFAAALCTVVALALSAVVTWRSMRRAAAAEGSLRALVENAPLATVVISIGRIVHANRVVLAMLGYDDATEVLGANIIDKLVHPDDRSIAKARNRTVRAAGRAETEAMRWLKKGGEPIYVEASSVDVGSFAGAPAFVILVRDVTEARRADEDLRGSLAFKDALLREIHHRVKNNLQVVSSLLSLHADRIADPAARAAFEQMGIRVHSIALLHEKLYRSHDVGSVEMEPYLHELLSDVAGASARAGVEIAVTADGVSLDVDVAVTVALIVSELATNAFKHALRGDGGRLEVGLLKQGDHLALRVADDGIGFKDVAHVGAADTLGMLLVHTLTEQLHGTIAIENLATGGACVTISFPATKERRSYP